MLVGVPPPPLAHAQSARVQTAAQRSAEARLLDVYRAIGAGHWVEAQKQARSLTTDYPNFQLAQLVYGDLLLARTAPLTEFAAVPAALHKSAPQQLEQLRAEARQRIEGLRERPPAGTIPRQFLQLSGSSKHAVAVDASRSRLYVFENRDGVMRLVSDHYASVGKLGIEKNVEGDQRTPLGVYYITSRLDRRQLDPFYGAGALPLNYPNEYDRRLGKTGSGIWLHGVPNSNYSRPPQATDGCVALANDELEQLLATLEPRRTPVVISQRLDWVKPEALADERQHVLGLLDRWRDSKAQGRMDDLLPMYSDQFQSGSLDFARYRGGLERELAARRKVTLKDVSILSWKHKSEVMVVTFGEVPNGALGGPIKRQYWGKESGTWKIFFEGIIG